MPLLNVAWVDPETDALAEEVEQMLSLVRINASASASDPAGARKRERDPALEQRAMQPDCTRRGWSLRNGGDSPSLLAQAHAVVLPAASEPPPGVPQERIVRAGGADVVREALEHIAWTRRKGLTSADGANFVLEPAEAVGTRPLTVFVHGGGGALYDWDPVVPLFVRAGFQVLRLDLMGSGHTPDATPEAEGYSPAAHVRLLRGVLEAAGAADRKCVFVGHSRGAVAIALYVAAYPGCSTHIVLATPPILKPAISFRLLRSCPSIFGPLMRAGVDDGCRKGFAPLFEDQASDSAVGYAHMLRLHHRHRPGLADAFVRTCVQLSTAEAQIADAAAKLCRMDSLHVFVVGAKNDGFGPVHVPWIEALSGGACKLTTLEMAAAHGAPFVLAEGFSAAVLRWLDESRA